MSTPPARSESRKTPSQRDSSYGCDDCKYLKKHRCTLWQIAVPDPANSHCESCAVR